VGHVLAVVSQKGGVGKTTTSVNLAAAFARRGLKTLVVDVDPQGAVRYGVGLKRGHPPHGFSDYLNGARGLREVILPTALPWLRVMLAGTVSDAADHGTYHALVAETDLLKELLTAARERCDVVIVDTPPGLGPIVHKVLEASQHVIVPLQCEPLALQTTPQILRGIQGPDASLADYCYAVTKLLDFSKIVRRQQNRHRRILLRERADHLAHARSGEWIE